MKCSNDGDVVCFFSPSAQLIQSFKYLAKRTIMNGWRTAVWTTAGAVGQMSRHHTRGNPRFPSNDMKWTLVAHLSLNSSLLLICKCSLDVWIFSVLSVMNVGWRKRRNRQGGCTRFCKRWKPQKTQEIRLVSLELFWSSSESKLGNNSWERLSEKISGNRNGLFQWIWDNI